jgi:hypothetical protein
MVAVDMEIVRLEKDAAEHERAGRKREAKAARAAAKKLQKQLDAIRHPRQSK